MGNMNEVIEMEKPAHAEHQVAVAAEQPLAAQPPRQVATTAFELVAQAAARGASMAELTAFIELQERIEKNQAHKAFTAAMVEFKKNAPSIYKDKNVSFPGTSYNHATLGGICDAVIATLAAHGISHDWDTEQPPSGLIIVKCTLTHVLGHTKSTQLEAPPDSSGKKNGIQQIASTVTYLQRYSLLGACGLSTKDMDDDGRGGAQEPAPVPAAPVKRRAIGPNGLAAAIASIKKGEFTVERLKAENILTDDQMTQVNDEVGRA